MRNVRGASSGDFNPLPRKEGDSQFKSFLDCEAHFNPLPRKEGDHRSQRVPCPVGDFNPLPRKEGDLNLFWMPDDTLISIHSLVKRETRIMCRIGAMRTFQSTPS